MKKVFVILGFGLLLFACADKKNEKLIAQGKKVYKQNCVICHGTNGKLGLNESKDLTVSELTKEERISIVKNGKGKMTPYGNILSAEDIEAVVEYTFTLK